MSAPSAISCDNHPHGLKLIAWKREYSSIFDYLKTIHETILRMGNWDCPGEICLLLDDNQWMNGRECYLVHFDRSIIKRENMAKDVSSICVELQKKAIPKMKTPYEPLISLPTQERYKANEKWKTALINYPDDFVSSVQKLKNNSDDLPNEKDYIEEEITKKGYRIDIAPPVPPMAALPKASAVKSIFPPNKSKVDADAVLISLTVAGKRLSRVAELVQSMAQDASEEYKKLSTNIHADNQEVINELRAYQQFLIDGKAEPAAKPKSDPYAMIEAYFAAQDYVRGKERLFFTDQLAVDPFVQFKLNELYKKHKGHLTFEEMTKGKQFFENRIQALDHNHKESVDLRSFYIKLMDTKNVVQDIVVAMDGLLLSTVVPTATIMMCEAEHWYHRFVMRIP